MNLSIFFYLPYLSVTCNNQIPANARFTCSTLIVYSNLILQNKTKMIYSRFNRALDTLMQSQNINN